MYILLFYTIQSTNIYVLVTYKLTSAVHLLVQQTHLLSMYEKNVNVMFVPDEKHVFSSQHMLACAVFAFS